MDAITNNSFLHGAGGAVWVDGEELAQVMSVELKVTGQFEEVSVCGNFHTYQQYVGYTVEGTLKLQKINSTQAAKIMSAYESGEMDDATIITKLENKKMGGAERVSVTGVVFTELGQNFEAKKLVEESIPFKAVKYEYLDRI